MAARNKVHLVFVEKFAEFLTRKERADLEALYNLDILRQKRMLVKILMSPVGTRKKFERYFTPTLFFITLKGYSAVTNWPVTFHDKFKRILWLDASRRENQFFHRHFYHLFDQSLGCRGDWHFATYITLGDGWGNRKPVSQRPFELPASGGYE